MATTLVDVLARRTRAHLHDRAACLDAAPDVAELLARELGWTAAETARQVDEYRAMCAAEMTAATAGSSA
jgi:glycerol-3-phosphate dehydrogenase